jgi:hypothetical protein
MRGTMYRAEVQPMPTNPPDRLPGTGLWKVVIHEDESFVKTERKRNNFCRRATSRRVELSIHR